MMTRPDERARRAIHSLRSSELAPFLEWLALENGATIGLLMNHSDPVQLHRCQGKAQFINDLLTLVQKDD